MLVRVVNDNVHPYREKFRGQDIYIQAKGSITMDQNDAAMFLGIMPGNIEVDANGIQKPTSYKMLRIEKISDQKPEPVKPTFKCMIDGAEFGTQEQLDAYIRENHMDSIVDDKSKEEFEKRGPGRPKKVTNDTSTNRNGG